MPLLSNLELDEEAAHDVPCLLVDSSDEEQGMELTTIIWEVIV